MPTDMSDRIGTNLVRVSPLIHNGLGGPHLTR